MKNKLALAMIIKNTKEEIELLNRCLESLQGSYDKAFITVTDDKPPVSKIKYPVTLSNFKWVNDFAKARNFNFSQVPEDYDFIMWSDADDVWLNATSIKDTLQEHKLDGLGVFYAYDHDEYGNCTVAHKKTMVVRRDSCEWVGSLHEELIPQRDLNVSLATEIKRIHRPNEGHAQEAQTRNELISKAEFEHNFLDPRTAWNYGNSLIGVGKSKEAIEIFSKFTEETGSTEEEYLAYLRMSEAYQSMNDSKNAIKYLRIAIGLKPNYPDAYLRLGQLHYDKNQLDEAIFYTGNALMLKPPTDSIVVFNPRDYDYNPLLLLAKSYYKKGKYETALAMLKQVQKIVPKSEYIEGLVKELDAEYKEVNSVTDLVNQIMTIQDVEERKKAILAIPREVENHPKVCILRNNHFIKTESSGKDIVFYCGMTTHEWNPIMFKTKGVGGSEESVIHLSKRFAAKGYNVEVYANIGRDDIIEDGVHWKPFWKFNFKDKSDVLYLWRSPKLTDYELGAEKVIVDMHDVMQPGEFTKQRLDKIHKVMVKSQYHRSLFPNIPDEKICVVPNGFELSKEEEKRDPMLLINTSSPDRSLDVLPELFKRVKEQVPEAKLKWAYGWEIFDNAHSGNEQMMKWKEEVVNKMEEAGIENLGRLSQKEVSKLYKQARVFAYPSVFPEICCISLTKAQAGGAMPVTSDFGVFKEKNKWGKMVPVETTQGYQYGKFAFGLDTEESKDAWVEEVVKILKTPYKENKEMIDWAYENYNWDKITNLYERAI